MPRYSSRSRGRRSSSRRGRKDDRRRGDPSRSRSFERHRPRSKSRSRGRDRRRSPSRQDRGGRSDDRRRGRPEQERLFAPPKFRASTEKELTQDMKAASLEYNGFLYATMDFTPPDTAGPPSGQTAPLKPPNGWEVAKIDENVREIVIKPHKWGTCMMVGDGGEAIMTANGERPGCMEFLWEYKKNMGLYDLPRCARHGRILIRTPAPKE
eukprot:TRINITY_DN30108_c0_g1_i1.p1 TRINITY_DN30108_c0_g1~~TRINITY_DN30108_c0_g1_i1.p1  ORF type:complete len:227 (-),score=25.37 TRINITY_DN30108_c0_g1_i1:41-670(-)